MIEIDINWCEIDELTLGFYMAYGEDEIGDFHSTTLGFLIFEITLYNYYKINL